MGFARDLIADALIQYAAVGVGDVTIKPYGMACFNITLSSPSGLAVLRFDESYLAGFLANTEHLVPRSQEQMPDQWLARTLAS